MGDEKVVYLSKLLDSKQVDSSLPQDSLTLISAFMEINSPEARRAVIDFCEKLARSQGGKSD